MFCAFTREWLDGDVAVADGRIAGVGRYDGGERVDASGRFVVPGLIDAHVHVESSKLLPGRVRARRRRARHDGRRVRPARAGQRARRRRRALDARRVGRAAAARLRDGAVVRPGERARVAARAARAGRHGRHPAPRPRARRGRGDGLPVGHRRRSRRAGEDRAAPARRRPRARRARRASWTPTRPPGSAPTTRRRRGRRRSRSAGAGSGCCCARRPTRATSIALLELVRRHGPEYCAFCTDDREPDMLVRGGPHRRDVPPGGGGGDRARGRRS